jgi:hypothetical protein
VRKERERKSVGCRGRGGHGGRSGGSGHSGRGGRSGRSGRGRVEGRVCLTQEGSLALLLITVREWGSVRKKAVPRAQNGCLVRRDAVVVCSKGSMTTIRFTAILSSSPKPKQGSIGGKDRILLNTLLIRRAGHRVQRSDKAAGGGRQTGFAYHTGLARYDTQIVTACARKWLRKK